MDKISSLNSGSSVSNIYPIAAAPAVIKSNGVSSSKPAAGRGGVSPDYTDKSVISPVESRYSIKNAYNNAVKSYDEGNSSFAQLKPAMRKYFFSYGQEARQNLVENLFSSDIEKKSYTSYLFSQLTPKDNITPFDEAAQEKALYSARNAAKKGFSSKTEAGSWIGVLGNLGSAEDLSFLADFGVKIKRDMGHESPYLQKEALKGIKKIAAKNPNSLNPNSGIQTASFCLESFTSKYSGVRKASVSTAIELSDKREFTKGFALNLNNMPKTEESAKSLGYLASNLRSGKAESVNFTSMVLDHSLADSPMPFKKTLLKEASKHFKHYYKSDDLDTARDTAAVLGKHFETLLPPDQVSGYKKLNSKDKINMMVDYFNKNK